MMSWTVDHQVTPRGRPHGDFQPKDESQGWTGAKAMMSDVGFMRALQEYKKDQVVADRNQSNGLTSLLQLLVSLLEI